MKGNDTKAICLVKECANILMEPFIMATSTTTHIVSLVFIHDPINRFTAERGKMGKCMD